MIKKKLTLLLIVISPLVFSQIEGVKRAPCFQKAVDRLGKKYVDWECGHDPDIIDCNEGLETVPNTNIVLTRESGNPYSGYCETCHRNGLRQRLVHFKEGKVDGIDTTYYRSGCPQVVRNHIEGVENGRWTFYNDSSGLVAWHINYFNGEKHGQSIYYKQHKTGTDQLKVKIDGADRFIKYTTYENDTFKIENYKNGLLEGVKKEYYPGSKLKLEVHYKEGRFDGEYIEYNPEGEILQERFYEEGEKEGEWKYYYNDGSLLRTESWNKGVKDGAFKSFYIQGSIQSIENYKRGMKHGEFIERFPDNSLKLEAQYKRDELIEKHVFDKYGNEIETVGTDQPKNTDEDDEVPTTKSKKWWQFWK